MVEDVVSCLVPLTRVRLAEVPSPARPALVPRCTLCSPAVGGERGLRPLNVPGIVLRRLADIKGAWTASLRDGASATLDTVDATQRPAGCEGTGAKQVEPNQPPTVPDPC